MVGTGSTLGDGGKATSASISVPIQIIVDSSGVVYFADKSKLNRFGVYLH